MHVASKPVIIGIAINCNHRLEQQHRKTHARIYTQRERGNKSVQ